MLTEEQAKQFANHWINAWNSHNLDEILSHYDDNVSFVSPMALKFLNIPAGLIQGKEALRSYFAKGLAFFPNLQFELLDVLWGVDSLIVYYKNRKGIMAGEFMEIGPEGKVSRAVANYNE